MDVMEETYKGDPPPTNLGQPKQFLTHMAKLSCKMVFNAEAISIYRMAVSEAMSSPDLAKKFFQTGPQVARQIMSQALKEFDKQKKLKVKNPDLAADMFFGLLIETPLLHHLLKLPFMQDEDARIEEVVRVFLTAYARGLAHGVTSRS